MLLYDCAETRRNTLSDVDGPTRRDKLEIGSAARMGFLSRHACMRNRTAFVRSSGSLLIILVLAGCAASGPRGHYQQQVQPGSLTNLIAYRSGTNLEIRIPVRGKDPFAHASWAQLESDAMGYQHRFAVLTFDKEQRAARKSVVSKSHRLAIRDAKQWQQLVQGVFSGLVPDQPDHGVLLLVQNREIIAFRNKGGQLGVVKLENKPPEITVDHTYNDTDFSREAIQLLEASLSNIDRNQSQFLFVTGEDPAFVFMDLQQRLIVFLSYPADAETQEIPAWFALRAFHSMVVRSLIITAIKNPFTLVSRAFWHLGNSGAAVIESGSETPKGRPPPLYAGPGMDLAAWEKELDHFVSARRYKGRVDLFIDGEKFFPAFIQSVKDAARSIDVLVFIFDADDYAVKIADLLKERSSSVHVRVLMDDLGSLFAAQVPPQSPLPPGFQPPANIQSYLESGSHVRVRASANPWLTVDHRKCIIIDGRQAYVGGMNIGREYRYDWHDMMVGLTGPIVGRLEKDYRKAWVHAGPLGDFAYAWVSLFGQANPRKNETDSGIDIRALRTATGKVEIYRAQLGAIERARRYIYIENAYFDDGMILRALIRSRQRGVDVRVIFPAENDSGIMQTSNLVMAGELIRNGIRVYAFPRMTHVKAAIYDGWACLGSANFDKMSLRVSQELDVAFSDPAMVDRLKSELFEADFKCSRELKRQVSLNWFDSLVKAFADQL